MENLSQCYSNMLYIDSPGVCFQCLRAVGEKVWHKRVVDVDKSAEWNVKPLLFYQLTSYRYTSVTNWASLGLTIHGLCSPSPPFSIRGENAPTDDQWLSVTSSHVTGGTRKRMSEEGQWNYGSSISKYKPTQTQLRPSQEQIAVADGLWRAKPANVRAKIGVSSPGALCVKSRCVVVWGWFDCWSIDFNMSKAVFV